MDYDFSGLCNDTIVDIEKKLSSIKKKFVSQINFLITVMNKNEVKERRGEIDQELSDLLTDEIRKSTLFFTACMNKIQSTLKQNLTQ